MSFLSRVWSFFNPHVPEMTDSDISDIRRIHAEGNHTQEQIGQIFGIHQSQVSRILARERRKGASSS